MKKEYRNMKKRKGWRGYFYDGEYWVDGKFSMGVTLSEVDYFYFRLMNKLEELLDEETYNEVEEVMQMKYEHGYDEGEDAATD